MVKTIETRAVISAQDRTGQTFAQVAQKLRRMEDAAGQASKRTAVAAQMAPMRQRVMNEAVQIGASALASSRVASSIVRQASRQLHENIRMENAGMSRSEIAHANEEAQRLSREFKPIGQTDVMHMLRNMRSVVGTYEEAAHLAEPFMKLRVVAQHAAGAHASVEQINEDFDKLIKSAEIMGRTMDLRKFHDYMQGVAKALNVFGDTVKPYQYFEAAQMSRGAASYASPAFVAGILPTMIQHMGGAQAGTAWGSFYSALVGGKMSNVAVQGLRDLGLVDMSKVVQTKTGNVKGLKPGGIKGWRLAMSDPDKWVETYLRPALTAKGITQEADVGAKIATIFSNRMARQFVTQLLTQAPLFEKDRELTRGAKGLEAADTIMNKDLDQAFKGLKNQIDALAAAAGKPFLAPLTASINELATAAGATAAWFNRDKPAAALGAVGAMGAAGLGSYVVGSGILGAFGVGAGGVAAAAAAAPLALGGAATLGGAYYAATMFDYEHMQRRAIGDRREFANVMADREHALARARRRGDAARVASISGEMSSMQARAAGIGHIAGGFSASASRPWSAALERVAQARQQVDVKVSADPVPIEGTFRVVPGSELLRVVEDFKRVSVKANLKSSIGSNGSTDMGNQQH